MSATAQPRFVSRHKVTFLFALAAATIVPNALAQPQSAGLGIVWEVEQRFRNFDFLGTRDQASKIWGAYRLKPSDNSLIDWVVRLHEEGRQSPYATSSGAWNELANDPGSVYNPALVSQPTSYRVRAKAASLIDAETKRCEWAVDGVEVSDSPCAEEIALEVRPTGSTLQLRTSDGATVETSIRPSFRVLLGIGDSYGSGQGNPDVPTKWRSDLSTARWEPGYLEATRAFAAAPARWSSPRCNRSFWSQQHMIALALASRDPHSVYAFVHLACTGAEVVDGLLAPQRAPSGRAAECPDPPTPRSSVDPACDVPYSQLAAAVSMLCKTTTVPVDAQKLRQISSRLKISHGRSQIRWIRELRECPNGQLRKVDLTLLSVGGNDIGFSGVVAHALLPPRSRWGPLVTQAVGKTREVAKAVCPTPSSTGGACVGLSATTRLKDLPSRLEALGAAIETLLDVPAKSVLITSYANPLRDTSNMICADPTGTNNNRWQAMRLALPPFLNPAKWDLNLTYGEAITVDSTVIPGLNAALRDASLAYGWTWVDTSPALAGYGWCEGPHPRLDPPSTAWRWKPYSDTKRRIRTANDSLLTQWALEAGRRDWLAGVFHPNAIGHAAIADIALVSAEMALRKR